MLRATAVKQAMSRGDIERHTSRAVHQLCLSRAGSLQSVSSGDDQAFFPLGQCREQGRY